MARTKVGIIGAGNMGTACALDEGPLANERTLETLGLLNSYFGYVAGGGTRFAPAFVAVG